ncbi:hypothetical protein GIB67_023001 [Kingdonia uniflora]|uniref:Uncharacterized protein n=1 Tax=Kingdonia uniflora TaxID=39325 RepID=A0A7J7P321_9MAGN|nr:hypothetical protein GIB67_023001 [Kingdonia uniflora]
MERSIGSLTKKIHTDGQEQILVLDISSEKFRTIDFPFTTRHPDHLLLFKFGESMALTGHYTWERIRVIKIMGSKTDGYRVRKSSHELSIKKRDLLHTFGVMGSLCDGSFLFQVKDWTSSINILSNFLLILIMREDDITISAYLQQFKGDQAK